MDVFDKIIYKVINIENNFFSYDYDKLDTVKGIHKIMFGLFLNNKTLKLYKNKINFLDETTHNFYFSNNEEERIEFLNYFNKIQRIYHTLNRFCFLYKIKRAKTMVNTDLQLNEINLNQTNVISIYHNNYNYLFRIDELIKIIYTSLTNTYMFFCEPITIKNPYNNLPFQKSILYYIYFYVIQNTRTGFTKSEYIDLFLKFKDCNFNITKFVDKYEHILREHSFKNYIINSSKPQLRNDILMMIKDYNIIYPRYKINIDNEFPMNELIETMKPYLNLYLVSRYSLIPKNKTEAKYKLNRKMFEFQRFNPNFGRKIIIIKHKIKDGKFVTYKSHIDFNYEHKNFNIYNNDNFMNNHLAYKYNDDIGENIYNEESYINSPPVRQYNFQFLFFHPNSEASSVQEETNQMEQDQDTNSQYDINSELAEDNYDDDYDDDYDEYENDSIS